MARTYASELRLHPMISYQTSLDHLTLPHSDFDLYHDEIIEFRPQFCHYILKSMDEVFLRYQRILLDTLYSEPFTKGSVDKVFSPMPDIFRKVLAAIATNPGR